MCLAIGFETGGTVFRIEDIVGLRKEEGELGQAGLWGFVANVTDKRRGAFLSTGSSDFLGEGVVGSLVSVAMLLFASSTNVVSASPRVDEEEFAILMRVVSGVVSRDVVPPRLPPSLTGLARAGAHELKTSSSEEPEEKSCGKSGRVY